jgi:hypothetical protein
MFLLFDPAERLESKAIPSLPSERSLEIYMFRWPLAITPCNLLSRREVAKLPNEIVFYDSFYIGPKRETMQALHLALLMQESLPQTGTRRLASGTLPPVLSKSDDWLVEADLIKILGNRFIVDHGTDNKSFDFTHPRTKRLGRNYSYASHMFPLHH